MRLAKIPDFPLPYSISLSALASFIVGLCFPFQFSSSVVPSTLIVQQQPTVIPLLSTVVESLEPPVHNILQNLVQQQAAEKQQLIHSGYIPEQYRGQILAKVALPQDQKVVALTFDDGPWPQYTNHILYVLRKYEIKATFFVLGRNAQAYPNLLKQMVNQGHALANHSWSHPYHQQTPASAAMQLDRTDQVIYETTGVKTSLFRPPGGFLNNGLASYAQAKGDAVVMWSADSQDYRSSKTVLLNNLLQQTDTGGILLLHDGGGDRWDTLVALPYLIEALQKQGYRFVTVPELLILGADETTEE